MRCQVGSKNQLVKVKTHLGGTLQGLYLLPITVTENEQQRSQESWDPTHVSQRQRICVLGSKQTHILSPLNQTFPLAVSTIWTKLKKKKKMKRLASVWAGNVSQWVDS